MENDGYIKLYRKILDNPVVCKDSDYFAVWCYLLVNATHKEQDAMFGGQRITLKRGQLITGRKAISVKFSISESKVHRILKLLEIEHQIEQQTSNRSRLITVENWDNYQISEQQIEHPVNNNRTTSEQQVNTNKNDKNVENDKKEIEIEKKGIPKGIRKEKFGEFANVCLTEKEFASLSERLGDLGAGDYIEKLSGYIEQSGHRYKSHYATILNWWRKDGEPVRRSPKPFAMKPDAPRDVAHMSAFQIFGGDYEVK